MTKPSLAQVARYFAEVGSTSQLAKAFYERYEANGWTTCRLPTAATNWQVTRKPMRSWKRVARSYIARTKFP